MADTQTQNYDLSNDILTIHSILDVFVLQNILDAKDAERLKKKLKTNRMAEDFLLKNRIVTRDTINKAYSIILKIPYIELRAMKIPSELMTLVPEQVAAKFHLIPFDKSDNILKIAISRPADLLVNYQAGLSNILKAKNLDLEIFITGETDFSECLKQYKGGSNDTLLRKGAYPVIYLRNQAIAERYLEKIPKEFIVKYRMVVFGENKKGFYLVACEDPNSPVTIKILEFIERENQIKVERFATSKDDIDFVLNIITERANSAKSAKRPINMDEAVTLGTDQKRPEENISEHPAVKDKGTLGKMLDNFLGKKVPELTIDEIPNADLVSNDEDNVVSGNTNAEPKPMEAPMQDQNLGTGISTEENREQNNSSDTSNEAIRADDNSEIKVSSEVSKDAEMTTASTAENSEVIPLTNAETSANDTIDELNNNDIGALLKEDVKTIADLERIAKEGFIPKIVAALIDFALNQRTSDIHIEPEAKITRIRCRIDGILSDAVKLPVKFNPPLVSRVKIMSKLKIDESRIPQDGRFDIVLKGKEVDVRVSTLPTVYGEKIVLRILDKSKGVLSLEDLGMTGSAIDKTVEAIKEPYGIILVTGPTGSGKSTTLYAVLSRINTPGINIVTLEDPVEYQVAGVNQCQIKPEIGFTFASGLRSILRQDPNVIMVGEIRDAETASMATQSALTGHLVLSTLHTNDTAGALPRLINMGIEPFLITSSINVVIAQRLVRRICPRCREEMKVPQKLLDGLYAEVQSIQAVNTKDRSRIPTVPKLFYGRGCPECNHGYKGRVGIFEVMSITPEIEELTIDKKPADDIKVSAIKSGMITMRQDGILKAFAGETTIDEVFQAVTID